MRATMAAARVVSSGVWAAAVTRPAAPSLRDPLLTTLLLRLAARPLGRRLVPPSMASVDEKRAPAAVLSQPTVKAEPTPAVAVKPEASDVPAIASFDAVDFEDAEVEQVPKGRI